MKTILILTGCLLYVLTSGQAQIIDEGEINGAAYSIYIPEDWNKRLVMYAHGYEETDAFREEQVDEDAEEGSDEEEEEGGEFFEIFTSRGYAFAASEYKRKGLVIKDGIEDTEALRVYFEMKYGKPEMSIITGHSMGGMITIATIEKYSAEYQGALPLCGWLAPVYSLLKRGLDMLATFDYLFGDNDGKIVMGDEMAESSVIQKQLNEKPKLAELFSTRFNLKKEDVAEVLGFTQLVLKETKGWMGGLPVENQLTIYRGFMGHDELLNKSIRRYSANLGAQEYLASYYTPKGTLSDPTIALHTIYDELLPVENYAYYEQATVLNSTQKWYTQQYVIREGHCFFTDDEVAHSFDQLVDWIESGEKPKR